MADTSVGRSNLTDTPDVRSREKATVIRSTWADTTVVRSNLTGTADVRSREKVAVFQSKCSGTKIKSQERTKDGCLRYGTPYGGHELPGRLDLFRKGDVYIGIGCGEDISFDLSIAAAFGVPINLLDPTPRAMLHVGAVIDRIAAKSPPVYFSGGSDMYSWNGNTLRISGETNAKEWWSEVLRANLDPAGIHFYPWGLSIADGNKTFVPPRSGVSHSLAAHGDAAKGAFTVPVKSFQSIVHALKDAKVGILKIDIEGHEVVVIPQLVALFQTQEKARWPRILLFDMDCFRDGHGGQDVAGGRRCVALLESIGYELFSDAGFDYTFVLAEGFA